MICAERAEWRKRLGERWKWSEGGVEDLIAYYRRAGVGAIAESSVLQWRDGRLVPFQAPHLTSTHLSCHKEHYDTLHLNTQARAAPRVPTHSTRFGSVRVRGCVPRETLRRTPIRSPSLHFGLRTATAEAHVGASGAARAPARAAGRRQVVPPLADRYGCGRASTSPLPRFTSPPPVVIH